MEERLVMYRGQWCLYSRTDGKVQRRSLGTTDKALALARKAEIDIVERHRGQGDKTIAGYWADYQAYLDGRPAAISMTFEAKCVLPFFGGLLPVALTPALVKAYIEHRTAKGRKPGTINTELNRLSACLHHAVKTQTLKVAPHIKRMPAPPPKGRFLTKPEAQRLLEGCKLPHIKLFVLLALTTAARAGAILDLRWGSVDLDRRQIRFGDALDGQKRKGRINAPINDSALPALQEARARASSDFVIEFAGAGVASVKTAIHRAAKRAGLEGVSPHVLRHSAAVMLAEAGVPMPAIAQFLGHKDSRTTERVYARFSPDYLKTQSNLLSF